ncbi:hypothetical protein SAMN02910278_00234 [Peptostreptococcus sp. D1]|nr:hypothetical protein SAMN02910278_00234 [Peptostreptococcus sp. D1]
MKKSSYSMSCAIKESDKHHYTKSNTYIVLGLVKIISDYIEYYNNIN